MSTTLGYFAADTLGVTLYQLRDQLRAEEVHTLTLGPWQIDLPLVVESDILAPTEVGFWVTVGRTLTLYVIIKDKENWLFVMDREALAERERLTQFAATTVTDRIGEFKPAIRGIFRWTKDAWKVVEYDGKIHGRAVDAVHLVEGSTSQGTGYSVASAPESTKTAGDRRR